MARSAVKPLLSQRFPVSRKISESTVRRLSLYLRILEDIADRGNSTVSSEELAVRTGTTAAQVRKDLSHFGSFGKRGLGYSVTQLAEHVRHILGIDRGWRVALAGAGRIGSALVEYPGFKERGFEIVAIVDVDPERVGTCQGSLQVEHVSRLEALIRERSVEMLIVAVPADAAEALVERAVDAGVTGVLNFSPTQVHVPDGVTLKHVNMVMELEALSFALSQSGTPS